MFLATTAAANNSNFKNESQHIDYNTVAENGSCRSRSKTTFFNGFH
jgi:hypothetical protein